MVRIDGFVASGNIGGAIEGLPTSDASFTASDWRDALNALNSAACLSSSSVVKFRASTVVLFAALFLSSTALSSAAVASRAASAIPLLSVAFFTWLSEFVALTATVMLFFNCSSSF